MEGKKEFNPPQFPKQRPLVFMWIAHYDDNTSLPQFDPYNFRENAYSEIEQERLIKFGLYPINANLAQKLREHGIMSVSIPFLPKYEIDLNSQRRLINYRETYISQEEYHLCRNCNKEFSVDKNTSFIESKYSSPICPHCGKSDVFKCKACNKIYNRFEDAKFGMCSCGSHLERIRYTSGQFNRERRWIIYKLGYQETIRGVNKKTILSIDENGNVLIKNK